MNLKDPELKKHEDRKLPWVEKYRPNSLDELISHVDIISTIGKLIKQQQLPHLLFYGPPGTGKTSTILAVAKQLFNPKEIGGMVLELNASDDRGLGIVRGPIMNFASSRSLFSKGFKLIILDEADSMTKDAQNALRRVIEDYTENTRFCLICNYLNKLIPAIQSRCTKFRFGPVDSDLVKPRLKTIIEAENVNVTSDGMDSLVRLGNGDMRRSINILQSCAAAFSVVNEVNIYQCIGHPQRKDIENVVTWVLNDNISTAYRNINNLKIDKGLALQDLITEVHMYVHRIDFPVDVKIEILDKLSDIDLHSQMMKYGQGNFYHQFKFIHCQFYWATLIFSVACSCVLHNSRASCSIPTSL